MNVQQQLNSRLSFNVPFAEYLGWPELSRSTLKEGRRSMLHLKAAWDGESRKKVTDDMTFGSAGHVAFLEPSQVQNKVAVWDSDENGRRYGKKWDAFCQEHSGKYILTTSQNERLTGAVAALRRHPEVRRWLDKIDNVEVCSRGNIHGVPFKARCVALTSDPLIDLKFTDDCDPRAVVKSVIAFGYDLQAYLYTELFNRDRFMLICVEPEPPYDVVAYELSPAFIRCGKFIAGDLINQVKHAMENNRWPGRCDQAILLEPPEWAIPQELSEVIV